MKMVATFEELHAAGCIQTGADCEKDLVQAELKFGPLFRALMRATNDDPCPGCRVDKLECKAFQLFHPSGRFLVKAKAAEAAAAAKSAITAPGTAKFPGMSVAAIAAALGVSKSEVRRRKLAGTI